MTSDKTIPAVSVVIAAYNCRKYLRQAVESVHCQTYRDFEIVIVDDGSTDDTWSVIEELQTQWPMVRGIRAGHAGTPATKNRCIAESRGEWIAILDADDFWVPHKLQRCMEFLIAHPELKVVYSPMAPVDGDGKPIAGRTKSCYGGQITQKLFDSAFVNDPTVVLHRGVVDACGGFDENIPVGSGHEFWLRVSTKFDFGLIDEPLAFRRCRDDSLTRSNRSRGACLKAQFLSNFYEQRGGRRYIPASKASARLCGVYYSSGKALMREGEFAQAREFIRKALEYRTWNPKVRFLNLVCTLCGLFE